MVIDGMQGRKDLNGMAVDARSDDGAGERVRAVVVETGERVHMRRTMLVSEQAYLRQCVDGMIVAVEEAHKRAEQARIQEEERAKGDAQSREEWEAYMAQRGVLDAEETQLLEDEWAEWDSDYERGRRKRAKEEAVRMARERFLAPYKALHKHVDCYTKEELEILAPIMAADSPTSRAAACDVAKATLHDTFHPGYDAELAHEEDGVIWFTGQLEKLDSVVATTAAHAVLTRNVFAAWKGVAMARAYAPGVGAGFKRALAEFQGVSM